MGKNKKIENKIEGIYRSASKSFGFVKLLSGEEIYISAKDSLDAMNDDRDEIKITDNSTSDSRNREGKTLILL